LRAASDWIVQLYEAWDKPVKAAEWKDKLRANNPSAAPSIK
jgi:hypothetical protein